MAVFDWVQARKVQLSKQAGLRFLVDSLGLGEMVVEESGAVDRVAQRYRLRKGGVHA